MPLPAGKLTRVHRLGDETLEFQFNPATLTERINANYKKVQSYRGSHEYSSYTGTESEVIPLTLFYTTMDRGSGSPWPTLNAGPQTRTIKERQRNHYEAIGIDFEQLGYFPEEDSPPPPPGTVREDLAGPINFLKSCMYPDPPQLAPPLVIFEWPRLIKIAAQIESLELTYEQFDFHTLAPITLVASLRLREQFNGLTSDGARQNGSVRPFAGLRDVVQSTMSKSRSSTFTVNATSSLSSGGRQSLGSR
ncbi:MAG TPA: hypothetical protein VFH61_14730 [Thermoleophilia bacterium]|nr:hypothetical protein [Thermoleophilia bacterium]